MPCAMRREPSVRTGRLFPGGGQVKTREKDRDIPGPGSPWNEIRPRLWMGGHQWTDTSGQPQLAVVTNQFDLVISLYTRGGYGPDPGVEHRVAEITDGPLSPGQIDQVRRLAVIAADAVRAGRTTLVRCHAGYNRSGLVVAQTLIELGHSSGDAVTLIRQRRAPRALNNEEFVAYLDAGLDVAYLLTGLDSSA